MVSDLVRAKEAAKSDQMKEATCKFLQSAMEIAHTKSASICYKEWVNNNAIFKKQMLAIIQISQAQQYQY